MKEVLLVLYHLINRSYYIEWFLRIFLTANFVLPFVIRESDHFYPEIAVLVNLIALWFYFYRARLLALIPLLMALFIHLIRWIN
jgi:hypothetical protein